MRGLVGVLRALAPIGWHLNKPLIYSDRSLVDAKSNSGREATMDGISWADLDAQEQDALENLREGLPTFCCDPAVLTLRRIGLIRAVAELTPEAEKLLADAPAKDLHFSSWLC
jgi:hypothetical protein